MAADGSIIIETDIDNKKAQQELNRLSRKIQNLNDQIYTKDASCYAIKTASGRIRFGKSEVGKYEGRI